MRGEIGRRPEFALDNFAAEVGDDEVLRFEAIVIHAARFDDHQAIFAADAAGVAEGVEDQAVANEFEVGIENLLAEAREEHVRDFGTRSGR